MGEIDVEEGPSGNPIGVLDKHTDPFARREGKTLVWKNVNMILTSKDQPARRLLDDVWGEVPSKETTAIMGPSGAGKSSLLNILAGRARSHGNVKVEADIRLNNYAVDPTKIEVRKYIAFVAQDDSLQVTSTPREAIRFSAKLRLSRDLTSSELDLLVERVLTELGLSSCADTIVGGALLKGISGGERKRTSVGVELVVKPALIYLDEPTSGLDSYSAVQLCQVLKKVANAGASVLFTIHQPSSEIFDSFDRLILLNKGRVMYQGSVKDVPKYFGERGHPNPPNYNPADWVMQVAQSVKISELDAAGYFPKNIKDVKPLDSTTINQSSQCLKSQQIIPQNSLPPGIRLQTIILLSREFNNVKRDLGAAKARFGLTTFLGSLVGVIFLNVGESDSSDPDNLVSHFGSLIMVLLMTMFSTSQPALLEFPKERPVFLREYSTNHYSVVSYFLSRLLIEAMLTGLQVLLMCLIQYFLVGFKAPFHIMFLTTYALSLGTAASATLLGCSVEDSSLAQELLPLLFVPQMVYAGFFILLDEIPAWLRWPQYFCPLMYSVRLILVAEFDDCVKGNNGIASSYCSQLISTIGAKESDTWWYWLALFAIFVVFRFGALILLKMKASKFL